MEIEEPTSKAISISVMVEIEDLDFKEWHAEPRLEQWSGIEEEGERDACTNLW